MEQTGTYIHILKESLERKLKYLTELLTYTKEQETLAKATPFDEDAFAAAVDKKEVLIDNINEIDKGFQSVYDRVRAELAENREPYKEVLLQIQDLIRKCVDAGNEIETLEERNRASLEAAIAQGFKGMNQAKQSRSIASKYYQSMANGYVNDSFLYDRKK